MIADLNPYVEYKESGVPWLGQVPGHWEVTPVGRYFRVKSGDMISPKDERDDGVPIYGGNGVRGYTYQPNTTGPVLLLGRVGAKCGCVHLVPGDIWASEHALRVLFRAESNLRFFAYLLNHADLNRLAIRTAQPLINSTIVRSYRATLPPPAEQAAIVRFLDYADRRIRRYIRAKQKLIKLLEEQKQAIIHRAVTRGLDPNVRLKPSGVEWLGDVPEHWSVGRLGDSVLGCFNGIWGDEPTGQGDLLCFRAADFDRSLLRVRTEKAPLRSVAPTLRARRLLEVHDLLLEKSGGGDLQPVGKVVLCEQDALDVPAVCSNFVARMPVRFGYDAHFITYLHSCLYSIGLNVRSIKQTTGIQNLDSGRYLREVVAYPPSAEQRAIASALDKVTAGMANAVSIARHEIELMQEFRIRLITDVVTGKVDVREVAASLPGGSDGDALDEKVDTALDDDDDSDAKLAGAFEGAEA